MLNIFLLIWEIASTPDSTSGRRFCALFVYMYVSHHPQGNERTGGTREKRLRMRKVSIFWRMRTSRQERLY